MALSIGLGGKDKNRKGELAMFPCDSRDSGRIHA